MLQVKSVRLSTLLKSRYQAQSRSTKAGQRQFSQMLISLIESVSAQPMFLQFIILTEENINSATFSFEIKFNNILGK